MCFAVQTTRTATGNSRLPHARLYYARLRYNVIQASAARTRAYRHRHCPPPPQHSPGTHLCDDTRLTKHCPFNSFCIPAAHLLSGHVYIIAAVKHASSNCTYQSASLSTIMSLTLKLASLVVRTISKPVGVCLPPHAGRPSSLLMHHASRTP